MTVVAESSELTVTFDTPVSPARAAETNAVLQQSLEKPAAVAEGQDPGPTYPVVRCSDGKRTFTDRNGTFNVRYNCGYNNVNWGYNVSPAVVAIAVSNMQETGVPWYKGSQFLGKNSPHNVPVDYFLHGTQGGVNSADLLHWYDTMTFRVNAGGNPGTANLNVGGSFVVYR
ncbi:hypothetical protein ACFC1R_34690 [Kitasatospora sp. NPDC056138]|uniref:hypothetical protein n=1 Tax=Kitasatospora sp. NPDC056138 TaxID=3345724 RepID=UPI0035E1DEF5